ncbi:MAG TPA: VOC family protein [Mucilaginibacter sp.]|jgi:uncharacterized glyoxalase superfamily protein PhnB|nr:VOC family protein [Mucilaginibacter sp.]
MKAKKFIRCNPHLPVKNLRQTLDYYRDTLGFYDEWTWPDKNGNCIDGGIRRDEMRLLFGEEPDIVDSNAKIRLSIMWFVDNIEDIYAEYLAMGIAIAAELKTHPYGLREFAFMDINGYYIRVAEGVEE